MKNVKNLYKSVVRINAYNQDFDFITPMNKGKPSRSSGSGFFIDKDGCILTCAHVVEDAIKVTCNIPSEGQTEFPLEILGICPYFDIAMLRIKNYKVKHVLKLASDKVISTRVLPGNETYAIGFPLGTETLKISKGILSGVQENFYQTDTPINPGNSGGPLMIGEYVVGINAAGVLLADNIGYAVPIYRVELIKKELQQRHSLIHYPSLMFEYQKSNSGFRKCHDYKGNGVIVTQIPDASIFVKSGIRAGDVLCSINGIHVDNFGNMEALWLNQKMSIKNFLSNITLNSKVTIEFYSGGMKKEHSFTFKEMKPPIRQIYPIFEKKAVDYVQFAGMIFMNLSLNHLKIRELKNPEIARFLMEKNQSEGKVIVVNISSDSFVNDLNIFSKGDIISTVNNKKIDNIQQMRKVLKTHLKCGSVSLKNSKNDIMYVPKSKHS